MDKSEIIRKNKEFDKLNVTRVAGGIRVIRSRELLDDIDTSPIKELLEKKGYANGKDLSFFAISLSARRTLPYGRWSCYDGRQVIFNREYQPILQEDDGVYSYCDRNEYIDNTLIESVQYFYNDLSSPIRYLTKHLGHDSVDAEETRNCKKSLLICLRILRDFSPKEHSSVTKRFTVA